MPGRTNWGSQGGYGPTPTTDPQTSGAPAAGQGAAQSTPKSETKVAAKPGGSAASSKGIG